MSVSEDDKEWLLLKWGTLKGWSLVNETSINALQSYVNGGDVMLGAMMQRDTDAQKKALCDLIDVLDGHIQNDWSGKMMTKDEAKKYVMDYGKE